MAEEGQVIAIHKVEEFDPIVTQAADDKLIVVDFTASWCPPCRFIAPVFAELAKGNPAIIFLKVDVDEVKEISQKYEVTAMPTFVFLKKGEVVHRIVGADKAGLVNKVKELSTAPAAATSTA